MIEAEYTEDAETGQKRLTGRAKNEAGLYVEPDYWLGQYSDMPHILSFLNQDYQTIFDVLQTDPQVLPLLGPFQTALKNKAMEQLEGMIGTIRYICERN